MRGVVMGIDHVAVQTASLESALAFYVGIVGATVLKRERFKLRDSAWLSAGGLNIELYSKRDGENLLAWSDHYAGPVHLAFTVDDLDAFLERALAAGASFHPSHPEPFVPQAPGAGRVAYLLGPDGEEVEFREADEHEREAVAEEAVSRSGGGS